MPEMHANDAALAIVPFLMVIVVGLIVYIWKQNRDQRESEIKQLSSELKNIGRAIEHLAERMGERVTSLERRVDAIQAVCKYHSDVGVD